LKLHPTEEELERLVDQGQLSEIQALRLLESSERPAKQLAIYDINEAYSRYVAGQLSEDLFYQSLLGFIERTVKRQSPDRSTFSNIEDAINNSALDIWQRLKEFDIRRSSFRTFVTVIVLSQIRMLLRRYTSDRGGMEHRYLDEAEMYPSKDLSQEQQLLFSEWLKGLEPKDRAVVQMLKDGLTQAEIGQALGISQQAVAQRLLRIRRQEKPPF
jgi:RNA polymerase sigma factor (sigma-70 family)